MMLMIQRQVGIWICVLDVENLRAPSSVFYLPVAIQISGGVSVKPHN